MKRKSSPTDTVVFEEEVAIENSSSYNTASRYSDLISSVNCEPIYQALQVYEYLGIREEFQNVYTSDRKAQADILLAKSLSISNEKNDQLTLFLEEVVGFFIVEYATINSVHGFYSSSDSDALWDFYLKKVGSEGLLSPIEIRNINDAKICLQVKSTFLNFITTMDVLSFPVYKISEGLITLTSKYVEILKSVESQKLNTVLDADDFSPLMNVGEKLYLTYLDKFTFLNKPQFSWAYNDKILPFSKAFNAVYDIIANFIDVYYDFIEGIQQQNGELDDFAKKVSIVPLYLYYLIT